MPDTNNSLTALLEEMSRSDDNASALAKLGKLLYSIRTMNPSEVAVFWHLMQVCSPNATSPQSIEIVRAVRTSLWARMRTILSEELLHQVWGPGNVSQIMEIMRVNGVPRADEAKKGFWRRLLNAA